MTNVSLKCTKIVKTLNLYACLFTSGLCQAVAGPSLLDLQRMVKTDVEHIGFVFSMRTGGFVAGSIFGGILLDAIQCKFIALVISDCIAGLMMLAIPWSKNLGTLMGLMIVKGFCLGIFNVGANVMCLKLWGSDSGPFYQALHLSFGLGALVAPLIAVPFLGSHDNYSKENISTHSNFTTDFTNSSTELLNHSSYASAYVQSNIIYPFSIIGGLCILIAFMFIANSILFPKEENNHDNTISKNQATETSFRFLVYVIFLSSLFFFLYSVISMGYPDMLATYLVIGRLHLSSSVGAYVTSTYWAASTVSRLASVFLAIKFSNLTLIVSDLFITLVGSFALVILASYEWAAWFSTVLLGVGISSLLPAVVAWINTHIKVTNKVLSFMFVVMSFGEMAVPFVMRYFISTLPDVFIYVMCASSVCSSLLLFTLYLLFRKR